MNALAKTGLVAALTAALALPAAVSASAETERPTRPRLMMCDTFYADYWERRDCEEAGKAGLGVEWWNYTCEEDWLDWNLYVCY
jgi:hypothetical protein